MNTDLVALFRHLTLGVYVIGVAAGDKRDAFTASALMQASYRPLLLTLAIHPAHASYPLLRESRSFAVSVLDRQQLPLARHFGTVSGGQSDKMQGFSWRSGREGAPILEVALAYFDCSVENELSAGDHRLIVGRVIGGAVLSRDRLPLSYADTDNLDQSAALFPQTF